MAFDPKVDGRSDDDRVVAHLVKGYTLDNDNVLIEDPVGMTGSVIRSHVHLAVGSESIVANLVKCIRRVGLDVEALILQPWASAASCVTPTEKELGVIVMDFGAGAIDLVCFEHSEIEKTQVIPAGGELIRRDIAGVFECSKRSNELTDTSGLVRKISTKKSVTPKKRPGKAPCRPASFWKKS